MHSMASGKEALGRHDSILITVGAQSFGRYRDLLRTTMHGIRSGRGSITIHECQGRQLGCSVRLG